MLLLYCHVVYARDEASNRSMQDWKQSRILVGQNSRQLYPRRTTIYVYVHYVVLRFSSYKDDANSIWAFVVPACWRLINSQIPREPS